MFQTILSYFFKMLIYLAAHSLSCSMLWHVECRSNPGPLHWEPGALATGPPRKSQTTLSFRFLYHSLALRNLSLQIEYCTH